MSTIRVHKAVGYSVVSNAPLNDERLSWEARGMMAYLLTKPDNWTVKPEAIETVGPAGRHKVYRILKELEGAGYFVRTKTRDTSGRWEWEQHLYEDGAPLDADLPYTENPHTENRQIIVSTDSTNTEGEEVPIGTARRSAEAAPKPRTPRRDPWFEAVCSACRLDTAQMDEKMRLAVVGVLSKLRGDTRVSLETLAAADARWWAGHFGRQGSAPTPAQFRTEVGRVLADEAAKAKTATNGRAAPSLAEILRNYPKSSYLEPSTWPAEARAAYPDMARQLEAAR